MSNKISLSKITETIEFVTKQVDPIEKNVGFVTDTIGVLLQLGLMSEYELEKFEARLAFLSEKSVDQSGVKRGSN